MADRQGKRVPTIDDLRVKMCYICREEETYDKPSDPPKRWVHPCKCTLIAHETCLLEWIRTAELNPNRAQDSILKCPQCSAKYELVSERNAALDILERANRILSRCGTGVAIVTLGSVSFAASAGVYVILTSYGALAARVFIGEELYHTLLADDPAQWPAFTWLNLPLIPLGLVLGQTHRLRHAVPLTSLLFFWPIAPVAANQETITLKWPFRRNLAVVDPSLGLYPEVPTLRDIIFSWPPGPFLLTFGLSLVRGFYNKHLARLRRRLLGDAADGPVDADGNAGGGVRELVFEPLQVDIRIEEEEIGEREAPRQPQQQADEGVGPNAAGPAAAADVQQADGQPNAQAVVEPQAPAPVPAAGANPPGVPRERAAAIRITGGTLGRLLGGALLLPFAGAAVGRLLARLARHSPLLRTLLAVKPAGNAARLAAYVAAAGEGAGGMGGGVWGASWRATFMRAEGRGLVAQVGYALVNGAALTACMLGAGSPAWRSVDPVWWRSTIGLGLWVATRDAVSLWYAWLAQRELRSRTLRDRSFADVDPRELDLIPERAAELV